MTVQELCERLRGFPDETEVRLEVTDMRGIIDPEGKAQTVPFVIGTFQPTDVVGANDYEENTPVVVILGMGT